MANNYLYYFDKVATNGKYYRHYYGEYQSNFNMSFTLDKTRDSCKIEIYNFNSSALLPYTIVFIESNNTFWVVSKDSVERNETEDNASGFYKHTLSLSGPFDLLNARDLTNCGFNIDRYTYTEFLTRLASLTDYELPITFVISPYIDGNQIVRYLKTYQNYSPKSAIRELFEGCNCEAKMTFTTATENDDVYLTGATITAISKSGTSATPIYMTHFNNSNEQTTIDKESYGTRVVSNAENVVSADEVRYPSTYSKLATTNEATIDFSNAYLQLPTDIYKVSSLTICMPCRIYIYYMQNLQEVFAYSQDINGTVDYDTFKDILDATIDSIGGITPTYTDDDLQTIYNQLLQDGIGVRTIQNGGYYTQLDSTWHGDHRVVSTSGLPRDICLNDEIHKNTNPTTPYDSTIWWKQGDNKIYLKPLYDVFSIEPFTFADKIKIGTSSGGNVYARIEAKTSSPLPIYNTTFYCVYTPMSDLKIKVENDNEQNDTNLFNQNGKFVDSGSVSKLINAHAVEISTDEKVMYNNYYDYDDIPTIGQRVYDSDNNIYIINNVSIDFIDNDDGNYYYTCQFAMTKNTACKSTLVSANTNIRDYECPQQNNVKRVQLYRDYIEFGYTDDNPSNTPYLGLDQVFNFTSSNYGFNDNHSCFVKVQADEFIDENDNPNGNFYYYLQCTKFNLNKQFIEMCDFLDNNIIGYESGVPYFVLQPQTLLGWKNSAVNTPISYVDSKGELNSIELLFVDKTQLYTTFDSIYGTDTINILSKFVSITESTYDYAEQNGYDIKISEDTYDKDGLEVPVFEYSCQVGDSNGITFGQDFLKGALPNGNYSYQVQRSGTYSNSLPQDTLHNGVTKTYTYTDSDLIGLDITSVSMVSLTPPIATTTIGTTFDSATGTFTISLTYNNIGSFPLLYNDFVLRYYYNETIIRSDFVYRYRVVNEVETITQENATLFTSESDKTCSFSYDENTRVLTITLNNNNTNIYGRDIVFFAYKYDSEGINKRFMFAINECKVSSTNTITLYVNTWKLK